MRRRRTWERRRTRGEQWGDLEEIVRLIRQAFPPVEPRPEFVAGLHDRLMIAAEVRLRPHTVVVQVRPPLWLALMLPVLGAVLYLWRNRDARQAILAGLGRS